MCQRKAEKGNYNFVKKNEGFSQYNFAHKLIFSSFTACTIQ